MNTFKPWPKFDREEIDVVQSVLSSGKINQWTGHEVCDFEKEYASYLGVKHAIALANGSVALDLALIVLNIGIGDEVIVTPRSFVASASCIALRGAVPVFADVDSNTQNITLESVQKVFTNKTKAIIAVHLAGWPCELDKLREFCDAKKIYLIEDCAQAHGAKFKGKPVGSFGHVSAFSFCQDKIITTGGEGGLLATNDDLIWEKAWSFKDHGKDYNKMFSSDKPSGFNWVVKEYGTNYRMMEIQAAIGRIQLKKLDSWIDRRRSFAKIYNRGFSKCSLLRTTFVPADYYHAYYKYYVFIKPELLQDGWSRDRIIDELNAKGIPCWTGSCPEIYLEKPFRKYCGERLPVAKLLGETSIMFFLHPTLCENDINYIVEQSTEVVNKASK